jgi:Ion channel
MSMSSAPGEQGTGAVPEDAAPAQKRAASPPGRYGLLLLLLIATYLLSAFFSGGVIIATQVVLFVVLLLLALHNSLVPTWIARLMIGVVVAGSAVAFGLAVAQPSTVAVGIAQLWTGLVLLAAVVVIMRRILASTTVTLQSIYGALSAYMVIGLMFAAFYAALDKLGGGGFFAGGQPADTRTFQYFSFTTLTTLGYGDFTAAKDAGRAIAVMEAMFGQIFLATLVARLVSAFRPSGPRK